MAGVAYYSPDLYLLLIWDVSCLGEVSKIQQEALNMNKILRVVIFNWYDRDIGVGDYNIIPSSQCLRSVSFDSTLPAWCSYVERELSPR